MTRMICNPNNESNGNSEGADDDLNFDKMDPLIPNKKVSAVLGIASSFVRYLYLRRVECAGQGVRNRANKLIQYQ